MIVVRQRRKSRTPTVTNFRWNFSISQKFTFPISPFLLSLIPHFTLSLRRITHTPSSKSKMDSSATAAHLLRHSSSSSHHFLDFFSSPPSQSSAPVSASDDFNESEVFWTADFASSSNNSPLRSSDDRAASFIPPPNSGILAALTDDSDYDRKQRIGTILTRETSINRLSSSSTRSIPRPVQSNRDYSQSLPCKKIQQSAPINVPEAMSKQTNNREILGREEEEEEMLPPHEIVARGSGVSPKTTFSVLEGAGRTLKGRDLRRVRNAVWHGIGFVD